MFCFEVQNAFSATCHGHGVSPGTSCPKIKYLAICQTTRKCQTGKQLPLQQWKKYMFPVSTFAKIMPLSKHSTPWVWRYCPCHVSPLFSLVDQKQGMKPPLPRTLSSEGSPLRIPAAKKQTRARKKRHSRHNSPGCRNRRLLPGDHPTRFFFLIFFSYQAPGWKLTLTLIDPFHPNSAAS